MPLFVTKFDTLVYGRPTRRRALITSPLSRIREIPRGDKLAILTFCFWCAAKSVTPSVNISPCIRECMPVSRFIPNFRAQFSFLTRQDPRLADRTSSVLKNANRFLWSCSSNEIVRGEGSWIEAGGRGGERKTFSRREARHSVASYLLGRVVLSLLPSVDSSVVSRLATRGNVIITRASLITLQVSHYRWVVGAQRWDSGWLPRSASASVLRAERCSEVCVIRRAT